MKLKQIILITALLMTKGFQLAQANSVDGDFIVGGNTVAGSDAIARSTVALIIGPALCTGSIIDKDLIITAAHCLADQPSSVKIIFSTQVSAESIKNAVSASRYIVHPDYRADQTSPDQNDIALIEFHGGLPSGYVANHVLATDRSLTKGAIVILAGFGITNAQSQAGAGTLRATHVRIADEHFGKSEILLSQTDGHGACHGDSGGPAFLMHGGTLYLWGVTSRGYPTTAPDDCVHESIYTKIMDHVDFLQMAIPKLRS